jgi:hypothetical protein
MNSPNLCFIDSKGRELEKNEDGIQHIRQYDERWYVRVQGAYQGKVVLDPIQRFPLDKVAGSSNKWELPRKMSFEERKNVTGAGYITALLLDQTEKPVCEATLLVFPSNVTEQELDQMIKEIGQLALSTASCVYRSIEGGQGEACGIEGVGLQWYPGEGLLTTATSLLELAEVVKNNWNVLKKRPLKSFVTQVEPISLNRVSFSPQSLIKAKVEPAKQKILEFVRVESTQCSENEFICYVLDVYLKDLASGLADSLESLDIETIDESLIVQSNPDKRRDEEFSEFKKRSRNQVQFFNKQRKEQRQHIQDKVSQLRDCATWATQVRDSAFLKIVNTPSELPSPSLRLRGSSAYGSIFTKFSNCKGNVLQPIQKVLYLFKCIYEDRVSTTWEIYELWCFVRLYSAFILYANMKPPSNEAFIFEVLENTPEGLKLPNNKRFQLQGNIDNSQSLQIYFWYDTSFRGKKPDIRMEIAIGNEEPKQYCFDAKYKNYKQQGYETFVGDVLGVARDKYLNLLNSSASFILQTDESIDYWGELPFSQTLQKKFNLDIDPLGEVRGKDGQNYKSYPLITKSEHRSDSERVAYSGHKYGAIALRPKRDTERQLKKIIRLLLQYHASLKTVCIACGHKLEYGTEVRTSWLPKRIEEKKLIQSVLAGNRNVGRTALYCSCKQCADFWVVSHCQGNHHRLLKFKDSFHKQSNPNSGKWLYDCPVCGGKLSVDSEDLPIMCNEEPMDIEF